MTDEQTSSPAEHLFVDDGDVRHESVRVAIRVRPLNERERLMGARHAWRITDGKLIERSDDPSHQHCYAFDHVFDESQMTESVYQTIAASVVNASMQGINGTIFAYGQTSSGKTHTMMGTRESPGIIPFALSDIFQFIQEHGDREFLLRVSHIEIYNEVIRDLLNPENTNLKVQESADGSIMVGRLTEINVRSPAEVMNLLLKGQASRQTASTNMNEESSRSHSIFKIAIESRERQQEGQSLEQIDGGVQIASLNLVDLAGSERVSATGATGMRLKEGGHINKSLLTLGKCIRLLSEGNSNRHIPFRDSKLTRILAPALGGNSFTVIVCAVTPASVHIDETISTINFASRAKTIQNIVKKNEIVDEQTQIHRLQKEIATLKSKLRRSDESYDLRLQCEDKTRQLQEAQSQFERLRKLFINANNLDLKVEQMSVTVKPLNKQEFKRSALRRRRTVDPATFSLPSIDLNEGSFRQGARVMMRELDIIPENNQSQHNIDSAKELFKKQEDLSQGVPTDARLSVDNNSFSDLTFLQKENQSVRDRCARAETNFQMAEFQLKKAQSQIEALQQKVLHERSASAQAQDDLCAKLSSITQQNQSLMQIVINAQTGAIDLKELNSDLEKALQANIFAFERSLEKTLSERHMLLGIKELHNSESAMIQSRLDQTEKLLGVQDIQFKESQQESKMKILSLERQRDALEEKVLSLEAFTENREAEMKETLSQLRLENASLVGELTDAKLRFEKFASLSTSKQEQFVRSSNEKALKKAESEIERLKAKIRSMEETATQQRKECIEMKTHKCNLERSLKSAERQISNRENEIAAARNLSSSLVVLQKQVKELQHSEERSALQAAEFQRQISELTEQLNISQAQLERYDTELTATKHQLSASVEKALTSENNANALNQDLKILRSSYETEQGKFAESCDEISRLRQELDEVLGKLKLAETRRNDAEESTVQAHFRLEELSVLLQDKVKKEETRNKELSDQLILLEKQNQEVRQRYDLLTNSLDDEKFALKQLSESESSLRVEVENLQSSLKRNESELSHAQRQLNSLNAQHQDLIGVHGSTQLQLDQAQKETSDLRAKNMKHLQNSSRLTDELNLIQSKLLEAETREASLTHRNSVLESKVSHLLHENEQLLQDISNSHRADSYLQTVQELQCSVEKLNEEVRSKTDALELANQKLISVEKNNDKKVRKIMQKFKEYAVAKGACSNCGASRERNFLESSENHQTTLQDKENNFSVN